MPLYVKHTAYSFLLCVFMGILCPKLLCHSNSHSIYLYLIHLSGLFQHLARQSYHIIIFWRLYNIFLIYFFVDFRIQSAFPFVSKFQWPFHLFFFFPKAVPRCWERLRAGGEGDDRGWDDWMASLTQRTRIWVDSRNWWWTGRPGVLRFMGSQRVGHDWATELNWRQFKGTVGLGFRSK